MIENFKIVKALLEKHNYIVQIHYRDFGCSVKFPRRCEYPQHDPFEVNYRLDPTKGHVKVEITSSTSPFGSVYLAGPRYAHKILTIFHTVKMCERINYNYGLVKFYINNEEVEENKFMQALTYPDLSDEEAQQEETLTEMSVPAFQNSFHSAYEEMAENQNIIDGYQALVKLFKGNINET